MTDRLEGVAVLAHGGGPTQVINASLAGVIEECSKHDAIRAVYGARYGILGVVNDDFFDLSRQDADLIEAIARTPSSALGSCRRKATAADYERILDVFRAHNVRYFFYNGGNDSMDTALRISEVAREVGYEIRVIGIPKTIDNDIAETDHCPGYGSAARFIATAVRDIGEDMRSLPQRVTVVEVMGRNAGWLVAATVLARRHDDDAPHLVYFPERPISEDQFISDVEGTYRRLGQAVIAVCEGQTNDKGEPFGADLGKADGFQHRLTGNLAHVLARLIISRLDLRARSEKPGLFGRASLAFVSATDREEARECGRAAVRVALSGVTDCMVTLVRESNSPYRCRTGLVGLDKVANAERRFPYHWINEAANDVNPEFLGYARPLAGEIEPLPRLKRIFVPPALKREAQSS